MEYIINSEKINKLLADFYVSTGIAVAFYDSSILPFEEFLLEGRFLITVFL
jgi:hypothetical protein